MLNYFDTCITQDSSQDEEIGRRAVNVNKSMLISQSLCSAILKHCSCLGNGPHNRWLLLAEVDLQTFAIVEVKRASEPEILIQEWSSISSQILSNVPSDLSSPIPIQQNFISPSPCSNSST
jgi:hypothetical protein